MTILALKKKQTNGEEIKVINLFFFLILLSMMMKKFI